ncbi:MAG: type II toxin-antitoxin system VapC family toxin [Anaerolineae bacterium]
MSKRALEIISDGENTLFFSAASAWEMVINATLGKLSVPDDLEAFIMEQLTQNGITPLSVRLSHALRVYNIPAYHRDPFDRLLIAQAQVENFPILTGDPAIMQYPVEVIW